MCAGVSISELLISNGWTKMKIPVPEVFEDLFTYEKRRGEWEPLYIEHEHTDIWKSWFGLPAMAPEFQFAVVRNPYERFDKSLIKLSKKESAIKWIGKIDAETTYKPPKVWLDKLLLLLMTGRYSIEDNLFCPQSLFLEDGVMVYKVENGLANLIEDFERLDIVKKGSTLKHLNKSPINLKIKAPWHEKEYEPEKTLFEDFYDLDFKNLDYIKREFIGESTRE